jgi:hypothetical protein
MSESTDSTGGTGQATGSGDRADAPVTSGPPPSQAASTSGLGPQTEQQGSAPPGNAPYDLSPETSDDQDPDAKSDSGT